MSKSGLYSIISIPQYGILYLFTTLIVLICLLLSFFRLNKIVHAIVHFWSKGIFIIIGKKLRIIGKENIKKGKNYIVVINHSSLFDIPAIMSVFPGISWFGKEYLIKIPLFGKLLKMTGFVPMKEINLRNTKEMLGSLVEKAEEKTVGIFPEGTRTTDGQIGRFRRGFIYLLKTSKLDILPVTLNGFYSLKPKTLFYINAEAKIELVIHREINNHELVQKSDNEIIEQVKSVIESVHRA